MQRSTRDCTRPPPSASPLPPVLHFPPPSGFPVCAVIFRLTTRHLSPPRHSRSTTRSQTRSFASPGQGQYPCLFPNYLRFPPKIVTQSTTPLGPRQPFKSPLPGSVPHTHPFDAVGLFFLLPRTPPSRCSFTRSHCNLCFRGTAVLLCAAFLVFPSSQTTRFRSSSISFVLCRGHSQLSLSLFRPPLYCRFPSFFFSFFSLPPSSVRLREISLPPSSRGVQSDHRMVDLFFSPLPPPSRSFFVFGLLAFQALLALFPYLITSSLS